MASVDSLLAMVVQSAADELHLGTDAPPRILKKGAPVRLSIPPTDGETLRHLLGELLTPERESALAQGGAVELAYRGGGDGFAVALKGRPGGRLEAVFKRGVAPKAVAAAPAPPPAMAAAPPAAAPPPPPPSPSAPVAAARPEASLVALLEQAVARHASDVHLFAGEVPSLRVDGRLLALSGWAPADPSALLSSVLDDAARAQLAAGHAVDRSFELDGIGRFRAHVYRASGRVAAALRVLPRQAPRIAELRFPVPIDVLVEAPHGLVLVCGPTGSGKSATLAALADEALRRCHGLLVSLEDPIEYTLRSEHGLVRQRQVGADVRDFPSGLKEALREDPDILLIGEMRDPESISLALTAAETGHLVLASLHSRSAASSIERIVDAYPAERQGQIRLQLADSLRAILAQRLLPRARGGGRIPACEILRGTTGIASLIREGKTAQIANAIQSSRKEGMLLLERCLADLVRAGEIDRKDALAVANDPGSLASYIQG